MFAVPVAFPARTTASPKLFLIVLRDGVQAVGRFTLDGEPELPLIVIG